MHGHKKATDKDPGLLTALLALVEPGTRGDPQNPFEAKPDKHQALRRRYDFGGGEGFEPDGFKRGQRD